MATNKFLIFDEQGRDMMSDAEYNSASQRVSGVVPGLADAEMHNKLYRQTSIMAHAIGRVLTEYGLNAPDNDAATLAANIKSLFCFNVLDAYPVGAIYISASGVNPTQLFGGTWEQISGRFLLAADTSHAAGSTGGEEKHTITTNEMPAHSHSTNGAGNHDHDRGTMNITGNLGGFDVQSDYYGNGAFYVSSLGNWNDEGGSYRSNYGQNLAFNAARNWTGRTSTNGNHTHTVNNAGGGAAHNNMPPYLSVYVWKRTA